MLTRRNFLKALSVSSVAFAAHPPEAQASYLALALAAAAAVASYIGSRGDPSGSFMQANFQTLQAISIQVSALNSSLQHAIQELANIRAELAGVPARVVQEDIHYRLFSTWKTAIDLREAEFRDKELGQTLDPVARYRDIKATYLKWLDLRNAYLAVGEGTAFDNALHVCLARQVESELCSFLITRGNELNLHELSISDLLQAELAYQKYFAAAQDEGNPVSLPQLAKQQQVQWEKILKEKVLVSDKILSDYLIAGDITLGCRETRVIAAPRILVAHEYKRSVGSVSVEPIAEGLNAYTTKVEEKAGLESIKSAAGKWQGSAPENCELIQWAIRTKTDRELIATERSHGIGGSDWSEAQWNGYFLNSAFERLYVAKAKHLGLLTTLGAIRISSNNSICKTNMLLNGDATCLENQL